MIPFDTVSTTFVLEWFNYTYDPDYPDYPQLFRLFLMTTGKDFTAALPGRRPADTLWSRGGARPRRPEYDEATVSLETDKPSQSPTKPWST